MQILASEATRDEAAARGSAWQQGGVDYFMEISTVILAVFVRRWHIKKLQPFAVYMIYK